MFYKEMEEKLQNLKNQDNYRFLKEFPKDIILDFSSNDYLNLNCDKEFKNNFFKELDLDNIKFGSGGSRLLKGNYPEIVDFEKDINKVFKKSSLVFNSGYDANATLIETLYTKGDVIFTDRYNHASIYDGIISSNVKIIRYKHLDYHDLDKKLQKHRNLYKNALIITESIYSMDGDIVDLKKVVDLKKSYNCQLFLDEAHSYGVFGYGQGYNESLIDSIDFIMLGLGKGGASSGGILVLDETSRNYIINKGRKFIYTTSPSPMQTLWNHYVFKNIPFLKNKIEKLQMLKDHTLKKLKDFDINTISTEQIISIVIGENSKTIKVAKTLREHGYLLYPIKEPTVPKNTARLRLTLTSNMDIDEIDKFIEVLNNVLQENK